MGGRKAQRMRGYDYSLPWWYFITICTYKMNCFSGEIDHGKMILNDLGKTARQLWLNIPAHYPFADLDEFIVMPNHIHGILIIDYDKKLNIVGEENFLPLHKTNLSNVIKGYKIGVTKWGKKNGYTQFKWQRSFYDRIIRNEKELYNIRKYICENILKWKIEKIPANLEF